ncbi:endonuclease VII domain-containing protein [Uniformispora flossi]|uniref:endonuclease VII domain-containing protein n=1 Tax=Uniformispora flossi TaxID=3390723 RepID=UPI003C303B56
MIKAQFGICPICLRPRPEHVDHDHSSGEVRGVLCFNCNSGLGQFKDRPDLLRRAAAYLEGIVWNPTRVAPGVYRVPS